MTGRRSRYLVGALCIAISAIMLAPLAMSVLASVKPTAEAAALPPTYVPHAVSLDSYERLWSYQEGLPIYLANSLGTALLAIALTLVLAVPAGYALARSPIPCKEAIRRPAPRADRPLPGAADSDVPHVRQDRTHQHVARAGDRPHGEGDVKQRGDEHQGPAPRVVTGRHGVSGSLDDATMRA